MAREKELTYTLDDRETHVSLTTGLGWRSCKLVIRPPYRAGNVPGVQVGLEYDWDELEALRQYLGIAVKAAMVRDDIPERTQVQVPIPLGPRKGLLLCLSPNDVENLTRHMREVASYANSIQLAGSLA